GAKALTSIGTAPGIMAEPCTRRGAGESKGKLFFALPGVPVEMKRMFEESVLPELERLAGGQAMVVKKLKCFGAGESTIAELLGTMMQRGRNPLINCTASSGIITLHIIATAENKEKAEQMAEKDQKLLQSTLGELIYGVGDQSLAEVVGEELARQGKTIAVAESCTGGLLAKFLTDNPGSSKYFTFGWITYSNEAKSSQLDVPVELIKQHGAVSEQVARAMAVGARKKAGTDYAISITGIAGPTGGTEQKPVGLVYIGVDSENGCETERCFFYHGRQFIRLRAAQTVLNILRLKLID
ncbi:MAG: nicotinamide-nucleotide amidohydrolase family protein, partial [Planctomycetota bacterium]